MIRTLFSRLSYGRAIIGRLRYGFAVFGKRQAVPIARFIRDRDAGILKDRAGEVLLNRA